MTRGADGEIATPAEAGVYHSHCTVLKPPPLPVGLRRHRYGARGSNSPRSACKAGVLTRGLAPRTGSGGGTRTLASTLQRRASSPLDHSGPKSLRTESNRRAQAYGARRPPGSAAVAEVGFVASTAKPASRAAWAGSHAATDGLLVMSQASYLCSSPQEGGDEGCEDNGCPKAPPYMVDVVLTAFAARDEVDEG